MKVLGLLLILLCSCAHQKPVTLPVSQSGIKVAVANFYVTGNQSFEQHFEHIERLIKKAHTEKAQWILLPELMSLDFFATNPPDETVNAELVKVAGMAQNYEKQLVALARQYQMTIIGASTVIQQKNKFINRSFYISMDGKVQHQDKVYPTPWERKYNFIGGGIIQLFKTPEFSFVVLICHDAEFPNLSAELVKQRPEVIFVPSQTDSQQGLKRVEFTSAARAIEHMSFVLMTGTSGDQTVPWHTYVGRNHFFTPQNGLFTDAPKISSEKEEVSIFHLDLERLRKSRQDPNAVYPARDI